MDSVHLHMLCITMKKLWASKTIAEDEEDGSDEVCDFEWFHFGLLKHF